MRKQRIYLETTLFNYYFDTDRDAHADTVTLFKEIAAGKYEAYTSSAVIDELEQAPAEKSAAMQALVGKYNITNLQVTEEVRRLANLYVSAGIIPLKYETDSVHIAVATINELDTIVSLNFRHIVKLKTMQMTNAVNILNGYCSIEIHSPMEVLDSEDTQYN
ncbi:MAG: hypothetical protein FWF84_01715 [Kiritimatiellaeota bacterium]|nr:hypothetical protein [Kiritimatiellota bacterium]